MSDEEWFGTLNTHVSASFFVLRGSSPGTLENRWGRVLNVTSAARSRVVPFCAPYEMAKGALAALTRSLAHEWAGYQVTVNLIARDSSTPPCPPTCTRSPSPGNG